MSFSKRFGPPFPLVGLPLACSVAVFLGCGGQVDAEGQTESPVADSVLEAILGSAGEDQQAPSGPRIPTEELAARPLQVSEMGYTQGSPDAPLKVLEFSDFGCGYCSRFQLETYPALKELYIDSGLVEWKYIPFVLGRFPNGLEAAIAGECAGEQDRFFVMQEALFEQQARWRGSQDPEPVFSTMAEESGLDVERFDTCVEAGWRDNYVRANIRLARQTGVEGTPTFLIGGRPLSGALPLPIFRDILDVALKDRGVTPPRR